MKPEEIEVLQHYQMRATGEPVFVLPTSSDSPNRFAIKRPIQAEAGIRYEYETVYAEELETHQQATDREISQLIYREKTAMEAQQKLQQESASAPRPMIVKPN